MLYYIEQQDVICRSIIEKKHDILRNFIEDVKKNRPQKWLIFATGSSLNAANSARLYIEKISGIAVEVRIPSEFCHYGKFWDKDAFLFGISQSGRSASTIEALEKAQKTHKNSVYAITANEDAAIVKACPNMIKIECGEEKIGFVTKGLTSTILTLMLMGLESARILKVISESDYENELKKITQATVVMKEALDLSKKWYSANKLEISQMYRSGILSYGPAMGVAKEAETKMTETIRCPNTGFDLEEFIHGPNYEINDKYYLFYIGVLTPLHDRLLQIKNFFESYTAHSFYIGWDRTQGNNPKNIVFQESVDEYIAPLVSIVPFQYLAHQLPTDRGVDLTIKLQKELDIEFKRKV